MRGSNFIIREFQLIIISRKRYVTLYILCVFFFLILFNLKIFYDLREKSAKVSLANHNTYMCIVPFKTYLIKNNFKGFILFIQHKF